MSESLAVVFEGIPGRLALRRFPTPAPGAGELLVRVLGCTICGSDLHTYDGRRTVPVPTILGHEIVGEIVALGPGAPATDLAGRPLSRGARVTWGIVASCGDCFYCRRGVPQKCRHGVKYGHEPLRPGQELRGWLAEHCLLARGTALVVLPEDLPLAAACPASCATATVAAALEAAGDVAERTVCILGAGLLGLTAAAMVHAAGGTALCVDPLPVRRERSRAFGACRAVSPEEVGPAVAELTGGYGVDTVLELSGAATACETAWPLLRIGGRLILVGAVFPGPPVSFVPEQVVRRLLTIQGLHNYAPRHLLAAVQFLAGQHARYPFGEVVARWFAWEDAPQAFPRAQAPEIVRIGFCPGGRPA